MKINETIYIECERFRHALEVNKMNLGLEWFEKFPRCSCGDSAEFLGSYLEAKGFGPFDNVSGFIKQQSHCWLEWDGLLIDITADQFLEVNSSVIVTYNSPFHKKFRHIQRRHNNELVLNDDKLKAYNIIFDYLEKR